MNPPTLRVIELGGRLLAHCGSRQVRELPIARFIREAGRGGLSREDVGQALSLLDEAGLVRATAERVAMTSSGYLLAADMHVSWRGYWLVMLSLPWAHNAFEASVGCFSRDQNGLLVFNRDKLIRCAPQLAALVSWLANTDSAGNGLAGDVAERLLMSAHLDGDRLAKPPNWVDRAGHVGYRAEHYSLHLERSRKPPLSVMHVAAESDRYGYDIEDRTASPPVFIEVKGSTSSAVQFYLTRKEMQIAAAYPGQHLVHFWGGIDLRRPMREEYLVLRAAGYPMLLTQLSALIQSGEILAEPSQWKVAFPGAPKRDRP